MSRVLGNFGSVRCSTAGRACDTFPCESRKPGARARICRIEACSSRPGLSLRVLTSAEEREKNGETCRYCHRSWSVAPNLSYAQCDYGAEVVSREQRSAFY